MSGWIADQLSPKGRRVFQFIMRAINEGWSANRTLRSLQEMGLGYRRADFLRDFRVAKGYVERAGKMQYVRRDATISDRLYYPTKKAMPMRYATIIEVEGTDRRTGETIVRRVWVYHASPAKREDIERYAERVIQDDYPYLITTRMKPIGGWKSEAPMFA